jgi:homeodomain-containing protein
VRKEEIMAYKHIVRLSAEERSHLERLVATGKNSAAALMHARILLKADANGAESNWEDVRIAVALDASIATILRVRKAFVEQGLNAALYRKRSTRHYQRKLDGMGEAKLIALACSKAPEGRVRWTMQLLADKLVELKIVDSISDDTVHRTLKKTT